MTRPIVALAVAAGLALAVVAWADAPRVGSTSPLGARRGESTDVTIFGTNLEGNPRLIAPISAEVATLGVDSASWKVRITPAADTPVGAYLARVATDDGLSAPFLFSVGQVAQVVEKEENGTFETAQAVPSPVVVEGEVAGNDVDYFRFPGKKGQRVVVDAQCARIGSGVDPSIRLTTAARGFIASADDTPGLMTDARLSAVLPEDGDYVVELSDSRYQGGAKPIYRLLIGPVPVADEVYPLGGRRGETIGLELRGGTLNGPSVAAATLGPASVDGADTARPRLSGLGASGLDVESMPPLVVGELVELREPADPKSPPLRALPPVVFNGRIEAKGDEDSFVVAVTPGQKLRIGVEAAGLGSSLDGVLQVRGPDGGVLANADDTAIPLKVAKNAAAKKAAPINSPDPSLAFTVPAGLTEITLVLRDLRGDGGPGFPYRLTVEPVPPTAFLVATVDDQVSIPRGGTAAVGVEITRQGFDGPITLTVANLPPGLSVRPGLVLAGQVTGSLTLTASADASFAVAPLRLIGEGKGPNGSIAVPAAKTLVFAQQGGLPTNVVPQRGLPAAPAKPTPVTLDAPTSAVEIVQGYAAPVPIKAVRSKEAEEAVLTFGSMPMPTGLTVGASNLPAKAAEGSAIVNATAETPLGPAVVVLTAKGPMGGKDRTIAAPAVTLEIVRPAAVELAMPSVEVKAGMTVEIKGKLIRRGPFKEPVTVKLDGLPAGLKVEPVVVPPDGSDFTLNLVADPKAAPAEAKAQVNLAFQVAKKDYATPPAALGVKVLAP